MVDKGSSMMDQGSSAVENRSSVVEEGSCVVNKRSCLNNWGSFNNWSSSIGVMGKAIVIAVWKTIVVSVRKTIVITKGVRVGNHWVVIYKGAVRLTMARNTAVVVGIGISVSIGFSFTALTSKIDKRSNLMTMMDNRSSMVNHWSNMVYKSCHMVNQRN